MRSLAVACVALAVFFASDRLALAKKTAPPAPPAQKSVQQPAPSPAELFASGEKYRWGLDAPIDWSAAARSYAEAARQGHAEAMTRLGLMYELGAGVPYDEAHMLDLFRGAAELGNAAAMTQLGLLSLQGKAVARSRRVAMRHFRSAADSGDPTGMLLLARGLKFGWADTADEPGAKLWALKAESPHTRFAEPLPFGTGLHILPRLVLPQVGGLIPRSNVPREHPGRFGLVKPALVF